jgi:hypothetical protein
LGVLSGSPFPPLLPFTFLEHGLSYCCTPSIFPRKFDQWSNGVFHYNQVQTSVKKPPKYQKKTVIVINRPCILKRVYSAGLGPLRVSNQPGALGRDIHTDEAHNLILFLRMRDFLSHLLKMLCHPCASLLLASIIARCTDVQIRSLGGCYFGRCSTDAHNLYLVAMSKLTAK